jgi:hypothetical protein
MLRAVDVIDEYLALGVAARSPKATTHRCAG